ARCSRDSLSGYVRVRGSTAAPERGRRSDMSLAQTRHRLVLAAFCSGWLAVGFATSAFASTCSHIQAELARLAPAGKWSEAAARQRQALALAERDARYLGCGGASAQPSCGALTKKIA